jgi:membrane protein required for colicin V production
MQGYDFVMIGVLVGAVAWGAWKGFAWQVASTASMVLSYFVALNFRAPLAQIITAEPPWNVFAAMLILFLGTSLIVWLCFNFVSAAIEKMKLKEFDRQVGAILGLAKGVILCVIITLFAMTLLDQPRRQAIVNSRSGMYIAQLLAKADAIMPKEVRQVLAPYIDGLEQNQPPYQYGNAPNELDGFINNTVRDAVRDTVERVGENYQAPPGGSYYGQARDAFDNRNQPVNPRGPNVDVDYRYNNGEFNSGTPAYNPNPPVARQPGERPY